MVQTQFHVLLTLIVFLPAVGAIGLFLVPGKRTALAKWVAAVVSGLVFVLTLALFFGQEWGNTSIASANSLRWIDFSPWIHIQLGSNFQFNVDYFLGADGLSLPMIILNGLLSFLAVIGSWHIEKRTKDYMALILLLETGVMGVFSALDLILFFFFWEVELIPMFLLIAVWGGLRREYAAWKFLLYTLLGSSIMLAGILLLYFEQGAQTGTYTANMILLSQTSHQLTGLLSLGPLSITAQLLAFLLIFFGFAVKIPMFPFHTWLPDAHTEAPTAVSVLLAGVLLKMGAYGLIRICLGFFPFAAHDFAWWLGGLAAINILYGAGVSMIQSDMKKMIAYSSVSHMGYVLLGVAAAAGVTGTGMLAFRQAALTGAALQMFTHGSITGLLFFCVGVVYEKAHTRDIDIFGGIAQRMPRLITVYTIACFASLGLPALSGFVAEYLVFTGSFPIWTTWTILGAFGIVLTAGYLLWMLKRAFYGPLNAKWATLTDATNLEMAPLVALVAVVLLFGIFPGIIVNVIQPSVSQIIHTLAVAVH
ncbi:MAG TPA: NADH-quinone oxidoreductase subunit M [Ktedonobacterales bacterium]|nr:NADH-quinone oxidoreductase subunit M [Ktedonobacterales bacterium]